MCINKCLIAVIIVAALSALYCPDANAGQREFTVKQDGSGDFTSISEAVARVPSESALVICEGVYNEHVNIVNKTIHLKGVDKDKCILQYNGNNYFEPALSIAAGSVSNLTIYACADKQGDWVNAPVTVVNPEIPASFFKEYAVHIEQDYLAGKELMFENCTILSDKNQCVGLGLRRDANVSFRNCEFRAYGLGGVILAHDAGYEKYAGACALKFTDCEMYNYTSPYFFNIESFSLKSKVSLTFQNVQVHTVGYSNANIYLSTQQNKYSGRTIDELTALDLDESLINNGYRLNDLIFCLNGEESREYRACVLSCVSSIDYKIPLPEGITKVLTGSNPSDSSKELPIFIDNMGLEANGGWCGSATFFLTPDSGGNTFAEMNYN